MARQCRLYWKCLLFKTPSVHSLLFLVPTTPLLGGNILQNMVLISVWTRQAKRLLARDSLIWTNLVLLMRWGILHRAKPRKDLPIPCTWLQKHPNQSGLLKAWNVDAYHPGVLRLNPGAWHPLALCIPKGCARKHTKRHRANTEEDPDQVAGHCKPSVNLGSPHLV